MTILTPPLDVVLEAAFGVDPDGNPLEWEWTPLPVKKHEGISTTSGRTDENDRTAPARLDTVIDNVSGDFTPDRAESPYYPHVGLGVPIRARVDLSNQATTETIESVLISDNFNRTLSDSWGRADKGLEWRKGFPGTTESVNGSQGVLPAANFLIQDVAFLDGTISAQVVIPSSNGANLRVFYRGLFYDLEIQFDNDGTIDLVSHREIGTETGSSDDVDTWTVDQPVNIKIQVSDAEHKFKVWDAASPEPTGWDLEITDTGNINSITLTNPGWAAGGIQLDTDLSPETVLFNSFNVTTTSGSGFFFGNVTLWRPDWPEGDLSEPGDPGYARVDVEASGPLQRLGQGARTLRSALARAVPSSRFVVAYWPMEDGRTATQFYSPITNVESGSFSGDVNLSSVSDPNVGGTEPLPRFRAGSSLTLPVPGYTVNPDGWRGDWLFQMDEIPEAGTIRTVLNFFMSTGQVSRWRIYLDSSGNLNVRVHDDTEAIVYDAGVAISDTDLFYGGIVRFFFQVEPDAGDLRYTVQALKTIATDVTVLASFSDTIGIGDDNPGRVGTVGYTELATSDPRDRTVGHVTLSNDTVPGADPFSGSADTGYIGETAGARFIRICEEEGIPRTVIGDPAATEPLGAQPVDTVLGVLRDGEATDGGILYESRHNRSLIYRTRRSMLNQAPSMVLDARPDDPRTEREIEPPFRPIVTDRYIRNDVTVEREGGSSARVVDAQHVAEHSRYRDDVTLNPVDDDRLPQLAAWRLHLGTWPGMRYPEVRPALSRNIELIPDWLGAELGDLVTVEHLPPQHPAGPVDVLLQGRRQQIDPTRWRARLSASPAGPWLNQFTLFEDLSGATVEDMANSRISPANAYLVEDVSASAGTIRVLIAVRSQVNDAAGFEGAFTSQQVTGLPFTAPPSGFAWSFDDCTLNGNSVQSFRGSASGLTRPEATVTADIVSGPKPAFRDFEYTGNAWIYTDDPDVEVVLYALWIEDGTAVAYTFLDFATIPSGSWTRLNGKETWNEALTGPTPGISSLDISVRLLFQRATPATPFNGDERIYVDEVEIGRRGAPFITPADHPGMFPFDIEMGGETMRVTDVSAIDGQDVQELTVTRSTNGVTKSHTAGTSVKLHPENRLAL